MLSLAAAEDITQRSPTRISCAPRRRRRSRCIRSPTSPAKELKYETVITVANDFAYGYEEMGGFQRAFEDDRRQSDTKLWPPLVTPDYTPYLGQIAMPTPWSRASADRTRSNSCGSSKTGAQPAGVGGGRADDDGS